jgi:hypothetical protein
MVAHQVRKLVLAASIGAALALPASASAAGFVFQAVLTGSGAESEASGIAVWTANGDQVQFDVSLQGVTSTDTALLFVNARPVAVIPIQESEGVLHLDSAQGDEVPRVRRGWHIVVRRAEDGAVILKGILAPPPRSSLRGDAATDTSSLNPSAEKR